MVSMKSVAFVLLEILRNLVSMKNYLNANNCWHKQNFENCPSDLNFIFDVLSEYGNIFVSNLIFFATENVVSFR